MKYILFADVDVLKVAFVLINNETGGFGISFNIMKSANFLFLPHSLIRQYVVTLTLCALGAVEYYIAHEVHVTFKLLH